MMLRVAGKTVRTMALYPNPSVPPVTSCNTHTHTRWHVGSVLTMGFRSASSSTRDELGRPLSLPSL